MKFDINRVTHAFYFSWILLGAFCIVAVGCNENEPGTSAGSPGISSNGQNGGGANAKPPAADHRSVEQILKDMEAAYHKADNYSDQGQVRRRFTKDAQPYEQDFDFKVAFVRPNKLRIECYGARVVCDGEKFSASAPALPNVVMQIPAPATLSIDDVVHDPQLRDAIMDGPGGAPVQIGLLLTDSTMSDFLKDAMQPPKLLSPDWIDDHPCNRVQVDKADGQFTLWIDQRNSLLRRIELPALHQTKLEGVDGNVSDVVTAIDFQNADFKAPTGKEVFAFEVPKDAKVVKVLEIPSATIAAASEPSTLKLTKLWTAADVKNPGNVLVLNEPNGQPRILVLDGWRTVAEVDQTGKVVARHELEIPNDAVVCFLRTAIDKQGKRYYVGSANRQAQFHVFDENWKRILSFPKPEDAANDGIGDVQIADLDGSGKLQLCVGYWGDVGVQGVSLDGNRLWREQKLQFVLRTAVTQPDEKGHRKLLCTNIRGTIVPLNFEGKPESEIIIPDRRVYYVVADDLEGKGTNNYCALAGTITDDNTAVGFSLDGKELWNYPLPAGVHGRPAEVITSGDLVGQSARQWLLAGADGSVHILSSDGKPIDKFNTGSELAGLGAVNFGNQHVLLVSKVLDNPDGETKGTLEAWSVEPAQK